MPRHPLIAFNDKCAHRSERDKEFSIFPLRPEKHSVKQNTRLQPTQIPCKPSNPSLKFRRAQGNHTESALGLVCVKLHLHVVKIIRFILCALFAGSVCWTGCEMFASHTNPIAGWHGSSLNTLQNNKAISDDYRAYINHLPSELRNDAGPADFLEDGTGQHAVSISFAVNGTWWHHVLIYDRDNKRVKVIKYVSGHYRC